MRDWVLVCLRHQMVLHDVKIAPLNLADCFVESLDIVDQDSSKIMGPAISLRGAVALPRPSTHWALFFDITTTAAAWWALWHSMFLTAFK